MVVLDRCIVAIPLLLITLLLLAISTDFVAAQWLVPMTKFELVPKDGITSPLTTGINWNDAAAVSSLYGYGYGSGYYPRNGYAYAYSPSSYSYPSYGYGGYASYNYPGYYYGYGK